MSSWINSAIEFLFGKPNNIASSSINTQLFDAVYQAFRPKSQLSPYLRQKNPITSSGTSHSVPGNGSYTLANPSVNDILNGQAKIKSRILSYAPTDKRFRVPKPLSNTAATSSIFPKSSSSPFDGPSSPRYLIQALTKELSKGKPTQTALSKSLSQLAVYLGPSLNQIFAVISQIHPSTVLVAVSAATISTFAVRIIGSYQNTIITQNNQISELRDAINDTNTSNNIVSECVVCMDQDKSAIFLPCRHCACCSNCAHKLNRCPICRTHILHRQSVILV